MGSLYAEVSQLRELRLGDYAKEVPLLSGQPEATFLYGCQRDLAAGRHPDYSDGGRQVLL